MNKLAPFITSLLFFVLCLSSCGHWHDNIKLSTKSAEFSANGDSLLITTKGGWWWVSDISVDGKHFYDFPGVDVFADSYVLKEDCFVVERREKYTLFIKLVENPLSVDRIVTVGLEAGDYH